MQSRKVCSSLRMEVTKFLIQSASDLKAPPLVKYSALSLFSGRFLHSLSSISHSHNNWLLFPVRISNLQLFALISLWISAKAQTSSISLNMLKCIEISDEHFTKGDFLDAEVIFLQTLNFEIGILCCSSSTFGVIEELVFRVREVAKVGEMLSFEVCLDVIDLVYENEELSRLFVESRVCVAASIVAVSFVISVPKQEWEFPIIRWLDFVSGCRERQILGNVKAILDHIML